jgi:hypothetical protein
MIENLEALRRVLPHSPGLSAGLSGEIVAFRMFLAKQNCRRRAHFRPASYLDTVAEFEEVCDRDKTDMTRADAIARARQHLHSGGFLAELDRRVAYPTESQNPERREALHAYLEQELQPAFSQLDFATRLIESPTGKSPYLLADYRESSSAPTVPAIRSWRRRRRHGGRMAGQSGSVADDDIR